MKNENDIWDEMRRIRENMDYLINSVFSPDSLFGSDLVPKSLLPDYTKHSLTTVDNYRYPAADVYEKGNNIIAEVDLPGIDKKNIKVNITNDYVEIKAEKNEEKKQNNKKKGFYSLERSYVGFHRKLPLPAKIDSKKSEAEYKDGVLKITMPKIPDKTGNGRQLQIK